MKSDQRRKKPKTACPDSSAKNTKYTAADGVNRVLEREGAQPQEAIPADLGWVFPEAPYQKAVTGRLHSPEHADRSFRCGFDHDPGRWHNRLGQYTPPDYELVYVLRGEAEYTGDDGQVRTVRGGTLVQRFPDRTSELRYTDDDARAVTCYLVVPAQMYELLVRTGLRSPEPVIACGFQRAVVERLKQFYRQMVQLSEADLPELAALALQTATFLLRRLLHTPRAREGRELYERACRLLGQELDRPLPLPELARRLHTDYRQLRALFARHGGGSPGRYRIACRMEAARDLLFSDVPLKEIALRLGYPDVYAFTRQFTRHTGCPPGRYRRGVSGTAAPSA